MRTKMESKFRETKADSTKGIVQLKNNPIRDLHTGTKLLGNTYGPQGPRRWGPLGELSRSAKLDTMPNVRFNPNHTDEDIYTAEPKPNTPHPHNRMVKPMAPDLATISRGEIGFLHRNDARNGEIVQIEEMMLQANPRIIFNPAQWNAVAVQYQLKLFQDDPEAYEKLTPRELFRDWSFDGVVEIDGGAGYDIKTQSNRNKLCTIIGKGQVKMHPYWTNIMAGSKCYIIIKKYKFKNNYTLNTKYAGGKFAGNRRLNNNTQMPIKPIQIGFYSLIEGGMLPMEAIQYEDEKGFVHSDSLIMYVGKVQRIPDGCARFDNSFMADDNTNTGEGHAWVNSNENLSDANLSMLSLILDPDEAVLPGS